MSRQQTFSTLIHIRDFADSITSDPTRDNAPNYAEIQADINIFEEDGFYSPNIIAEPIRTRIHAYLPQGERDAYVPNTFFYADGRFYTTLSADDTLEINIQALSLVRHPGDVDDFNEYRRHLPEQWCPMVTIIGFVVSRNGNSLDSELRHFTLESSVYDASKTASVQFSVVCFLENTNRWKKVKTPPSGAFLSISAKVAGRTADTNHLALRVLDLAFLPRPASAMAMPTPTTTTPPSKRSSRWEGRAAPSTPSKRPRALEPADDAAGWSEIDTTPPEPKRAGRGLHTEHTTDSPSARPSPSTVADAEVSSLTSVPTQTSDSASRPQRNRQLPKKYVDLD